LVQLFKPAASYIGIGLAGGNVHIVSAATGEVVLEQRLPGVDRVVGGTLFDGTLLVRQLDAAGGDATLTAIDVATAARLWSRDDLAPIERANRPLRVIGGVLPAVVRYRDTEDAQTARLVLTIIDARTGANVGPGLELPFGRRDIHRGIDLGIWPGVIVVGTGSAILPLETRPTAGVGKETS
jgi:hypothetical protein